MINHSIYRLTEKQKKSRKTEEKISKKMLGLDRYEAEKANERWYTKLVRKARNCQLTKTTTSIAIGITGVLFAAAGTAYYSQFHL